MFQGFDTEDSKTNEFHQRVADQNIQSFDTRSDDIMSAKNGFIGMLAGILVGGVVGWLFLSPSNQTDKVQTIPVIRRPLTPFKVQPNDPGGMDIDNQDREIYHIVDNKPKVIEEVNIVPAPDTPKLVIENNINNNISDMDNLVESISENDNVLTEDVDAKESVQLANVQLKTIPTNSTEKVTIPEKIENIKVDIQENINKNESIKPSKVEENKKEIKIIEKDISLKGTWYTQLIASSSRQSVENLWKKLSSKHNFLKSMFCISSVCD